MTDQLGNNEVLIEARGIVKSYGTLRVLDSVSLSVYAHEILAVKGASGAGKTTLLQILGTLDVPDAGSVCYSGREVTRLNDRELSRFRNRSIGFVFQTHQLLPEFTAVENVMLPALISGDSRRIASAKATELLGELGLSARLRHKPGELSGGERQRVAIARALVNGPGVVFADEPTGSLDSANRSEIRQLFRDLREKYGQTFVIVTHDDELASVADRRIIMSDGRIISVER